MAFKKRTKRQSEEKPRLLAKLPPVIKQEPIPVEEPVVEAPVVVEPVIVEVAAPTSKYDSLNLIFFTEEWIDKIHKNPADLLEYYSNLKKTHQAKRSTNLPGDDEAAREILKRLDELRRIVVFLGYPG